MYSSSPYAPSAENLYMTPSVHTSNFYPVSDNLFHQYRLQGVGSYYPEYHHSAASATYVTNGFLPYDSYGIPTANKDDKWQESGKYYMGHDVASRSVYPGYASPTPSGTAQVTSQIVHQAVGQPFNVNSKNLCSRSFSLQ